MMMVSTLWAITIYVQYDKCTATKLHLRILWGAQNNTGHLQHDVFEHVLVYCIIYFYSGLHDTLQMHSTWPECVRRLAKMLALSSFVVDGYINNRAKIIFHISVKVGAKLFVPLAQFPSPRDCAMQLAAALEWTPESKTHSLYIWKQIIVHELSFPDCFCHSNKILQEMLACGSVGERPPATTALPSVKWS